MAKYTTEVRSICESIYGWDNQEDMSKNPGYGDTSKIIQGARARIFDFDYPIFDENYRATLETKIIKHYYFREIGAETYGQWKFWLDRKLNEIMPYYNKLYESELLKFNPFYNSEKVRTSDRSSLSDKSSVGTADSVQFSEGAGAEHRHSNTVIDRDTKDKTEGKDTTEHSYDDWETYNDTPQGGLTGIKENTYLTSATHKWTDTPQKTETEIDRTTTGELDESDETDTEARTKSESKNQSSAEDSRKEVITDSGKYLEYVLGKEGTETYSEMLEKYRKTFLNIDMMVLENLGDLFMKVW